MRRLLQSLEESEIVIVTTEKTNSFISMRKKHNYSQRTPQKISKIDIQR